MTFQDYFYSSGQFSDDMLSYEEKLLSNYEDNLESNYKAKNHKKLEINDLEEDLEDDFEAEYDENDWEEEE